MENHIVTQGNGKLSDFILINGEDKVKPSGYTTVESTSASTRGSVGGAVTSISIVCKRIFEKMSSSCVMRVQH